MIKPDDLDRFKTVLANMKKATLQSQRNAEQTSHKLSKVKEQLADVKAAHQTLKKDHQQLQDSQQKSQKIDYAMRDMVKNDYGVSSIKQSDVEARVVLYQLDHNELTKNKTEATSWLKALTTALNDQETKIDYKRLDWGINQVKALINRLVELAHDLFKGMTR
ncbi:mobilization protein [Leuconostoc pseudomesenteroides]|uniref:mobilization protein n=1 Tax=Leuconostoc pseudomesenteroides TaxID=33968 RepID=UPI0040367833